MMFQERVERNLLGWTAKRHRMFTYDQRFSNGQFLSYSLFAPKSQLRSKRLTWLV